jgi:hypothetical protein
LKLGPGEQVYQIRKDLSDFLSSGLDKLDRERVKEISLALGELNLAKPAQMVTALLDPTDPAARFEQFVKSIQTLRQVELRLVHLDQTPAGDLVEMPMYGGLFLERDRLPAPTIDIGRITALPNRFIRDYGLAGYLQKVDLKTMAEQMEYIWGNASLTPLVVDRLKHEPDAALDLIRKSPFKDQRIVIYTAMDLCRAIATPRAYQVMQALPGPHTLEHLEPPDEEERKSLVTIAKHIIGNMAVEDVRRMYQRWHPSPWHWLSFHFLTIEAETFRPELLPAYRQTIAQIRAQYEPDLRDLMASNPTKRKEAAQMLGYVGCPAFIPDLDAARAREKSPKVEAELTLALALCGDLRLVDQGIECLASGSPLDAPRRKAHAQALIHLGDVRGKAAILAAAQANRKYDITGYGVSIIPDLLRLCRDPHSKAADLIRCNLSSVEVFTPPDTLRAVNQVLAENLDVPQLTALLQVLRRHYHDQPAQLAMLDAHARQRLTSMAPSDQKAAVGLLADSASFAPLIIQAWDDLADDARLEALSFLKPSPKKSRAAKSLTDAYPEPLRPAAAALVNLFCEWKNDKAEEGLLKAAAASPQFFIEQGDGKIIVLCVERLQHGPPDTTLPALTALGALGVEDAIPAINAMPATNAKMKKAVEQALARIEQNKDLRPPKAFSAKGILDRLLKRK